MPFSYNEFEEIKQVWAIVCESFSDMLPHTSINLWFGDIIVSGYANGKVTLEIKSKLKYKTVSEKYLEEIERRFSEQLGFEVSVFSRE